MALSTTSKPPRRKHATQMRPPAGIFRPLGIQEDEIKGAIGGALEQAARVIVNLRDRRSQTGVSEIFCREIDLILRLLYRSHRSADVLRRAREPERRIAIRRADLQHPARKAALTRTARNSPVSRVILSILRGRSAVALSLSRPNCSSSVSKFFRVSTIASSPLYSFAVRASRRPFLGDNSKSWRESVVKSL